MSVIEVRHSHWPAVVAVLASLMLGCGQTLVCGQEVAATERPAPDLPHKDFRAATPSSVVRVCRGDTVIIRIGEEAKRIGLIGVEVPGLGEPAGAAAEKFLGNLLAGEAVFVEFADSNPAVDRFGCVPAYLFRVPDGLFVNLELVRQGYASVPEGSTFEHRPVFEYFQRRAREAGKGRWAPEPSSDPAAEPRSAAREGARRVSASQPGPAAARAAPAPATQAASGAESAADTIVYVTAKGTRYHREGCRHLRKSSRPITLGEARKLGLKPCSQCKPPD
jgi:endonuclease YncB( thermonuclease family)